jgi:hypothetical protein
MSGLEGLLAGRVLGNRYRIEEVIGRGGMGAVYRATDERLGRRVAVKVITVAGGLDAEARERVRVRFHREARAAAGLPHHPNVVPVYDYGTDETLGLDYLVMELLQGEDLATRLARSGAPPLSTSLWILREAARGVAVGHRVGLVHRDVKPGNLFLADAGHGEVQVRVLDFGIAKLITEEDTQGALTHDGRAPLSPAFASPEQLRGLGRLSPAADVFSLGTIGFQLLTGARPFDESDRNRFSIGMGVPVPSLRQHNPAIPESVEAIIQRALAYEPTERPADATEFGMLLDQAVRELGDSPVAPYTPAGFAAPPAGATPRPPVEDDDRTMLAPPAGVPTPPRAGPADDDRTLLDPGGPVAAGPPPRPTGAPAPRPLPPRRAVEPKRGPGGAIVAVLIVLLLAGAGFAIWHFSQDDASRRAETVIPPPPDELPDFDQDVVVTEPAQPGSDELDAFVLNQEGMRLFRDGNVTGALEQFRLAREIAPENSNYGYNYGTTLLRVGAAAEAVGELERVVRLDPSRIDAIGSLGQAKLQVGDTAGAVDAFERVLANSTDPRQRSFVGNRLREIRAAQAAAQDTVAPAAPRPGAPSDTIFFPNPPAG